MPTRVTRSAAAFGAFGAVAVLAAAPLAATGMVTVAHAEPDYGDCMVYEPKSHERLQCMDEKLRADTAWSERARAPLAPSTVTVTPSYVPTTAPTAPANKGGGGIPVWGWVLIVIGGVVAAPFVIGAIVTAGVLGRDAAERRDLYDDDDDDDLDDDWDVMPPSPPPAVVPVPSVPHATPDGDFLGDLMGRLDDGGGDTHTTK